MLFEKIFINNLPLMDVRAPVEFAKGSFPTASNLPIMTDAERHEVGICYKQQGKQAAIQLGESFYTETVKKQRQQKWLDYINTHPEGYLFCLRGGLRSHLTQQLIQEAGGDYPLIPGGFKAMRNYLTRTLKSLCESMHFVVIGGLTGSGKTRLLNEITASIDLENMANHKGSAFGKEASPQPTQINFEHQIAIRLLQLNQKGFQTIYIEDEGRHIGRLTLPQTLKLAMDKAPVWQLTATTEQRIKTTIEDYVLGLYSQYNHLENDQAIHHMSQHFDQALNNIQKRLGGVSHTRLVAIIQKAHRLFAINKDPFCYAETVHFLLEKYYDPMYEYQLSKKKNRIVHKGTKESLLELINNKQHLSLNLN